MSTSVAHMLFKTIAQYPDKDVLIYKRDGELRSLTYYEFGEMIKRLTHAMADVGLMAGDRVAILSNNRPEWTISDFATFCLRGVVVPVYQTLPANQIAYILNDAEVRAIFVENEEQFQKIRKIKKDLPKLDFIFTYDRISDEALELFAFDDLIKRGNDHIEKHASFFNDSLNRIQPKEICSLVYTSGTTGEPKGVMLHHHGFMADIVEAEAVLDLQPDDIFLSFLPLSHLYERLGGHWCPMYKGCTLFYAQSIDTVVADIAEAQPTVMVSVPRLYEKIATAVIDQVESGSSLKKKIFYWALNTGMKYHQRKYDGVVPALLEKKYQLADKLAFSKIKTKLGGRFRFPIAGGAPLSVETLKFFEAIGLKIVEGYGMTESHLIITLTPPGRVKYGSCGKPIKGVEVKIADDGEVLVRGDIIMAGYYKKPELTAEVIDKDGWLHTGDVGFLDSDNFLFLTDRKKNIIVTSGGKNIATAPLENRLKTSRYIDDICLIGNHRKFISALIVPNYENLEKWAAENDLEAVETTRLVQEEKINELIGDEIERLQEEFARFEKVKKFKILPEPFSIEKGELTPSLKVKKDVVQEHYRSVIEKLYEEN
ncbi:MAG: long-chain fatty acid--CoA ligase [candidate division KSB1 bacterium]|nr:long-chain fatty acid--CoA ligase [candidate division KSB1 bacterium]